MKRNKIAKINGASAATARFGLGMLTPTMVVLLVMTAYPLIFTFVYSFTDYNYLKGTEDASFVLFENYASLIQNGYFQQAVWNTVIFTVLAVVLEMGFGLLIAVFVNSLKRGQKIMRTLLLYASLQSVSESQYEAARIDGAGTLQQFWYITLPNIKSSLALCALLRTIDTFRLFEKVNVLTGGGPAGTTTTITQFLYNYGIKPLDFGFGSAGAIVMTLLVLILSSFYIKRAMG